MAWYLVTLMILAALFLLWCFLVSPRWPRRDLGALSRTDYAHRGLWNESIPENSLPAFQAAADAGFGIELDVHITRDDQLVIFHDDSLERVCGVRKKLSECTLEELSGMRLLGSDERIPTFDSVLRLVNGRVPLIIELKSDQRISRLAELTAQLLDAYSGAYCIESFDPRAVYWYRRNRPQAIRGQLAFGLRDGKYDKKNRTYLFLSSMLQNCLGRPDFIAFDYETDRSLPFRAVSRLFRFHRVAWTVRSQEKMDTLRNRYELQIFEGFVPR